MTENLWKSFYEQKYSALHRSNAEFNNLSIFKPTAAAELNAYSVAINFSTSPYKDNILLNHSLGSIMGNVIGDSLGSVLEFSFFDDTRKVIYDFDQYYFTPYISVPEIINNFRLRVGQHTDDFAMALCLYDTLLINNGLDCVDLRHRFLRWWSSGYNNGFRFDKERIRKSSVGLGGNIAASLQEIIMNNTITEHTMAGDPKTSGNGSIMRLSGIPLFYHNNLKDAIDKAASQSLTTHQGDEAADCCRIMSFIIFKALNSGNLANAKNFLDSLDISELLPYLKTDGGIHLAQSKREESPELNSYCKGPEDRDWNWKKPEFTYSKTRVNNNSGYIGSYAMDGLSMALHCVYVTNNFTDALLKIVNMGGDSDTVGSIGGQIAGAIYGVDGIKPLWKHYVMKWDNKGEIPLRAMCCILPELREKALDENALINVKAKPITAT